jgi:hypothetical protein
MTNAQKKLLEKYRAGINALDRIAASPAAPLDFRPALPDAWTIREHVMHFIDAEVNFYLRIRKAVAEPGGAIVPFDEEKWTAGLGYARQPIDEAVAVYRGLRSIVARQVEALSGDWESYRVLHPVRGEQNLEKLFDIVCGHLDSHLEFVKRNQGLFEGGN